MKREEVEDFLNLPGIAGIALMDGRSRPYFYGVDQALNFQQKEALAQGIQQVVETTPPGFEFFEFQFTGHHAYIYKLDHGLILLVLTHASVVHADYLHAIERLRDELKTDAANAIATFRLLAGNISLSNQGYWKQTSTSGFPRADSSDLPPPSAHALPPPSLISSFAPPRAPIPVPEPSQPTVFSPSAMSPAPPLVEKQVPLASDHATSSDIAGSTAPTHKELLVALNQISHVTVRYLGPTVVSNYWKATRPNLVWLTAFQVNRSAQITLPEGLMASGDLLLTTEQQQWIKHWVHAFIERCSKVIRDFPALIEQSALDEQQKTLLFMDKT